MGKLLILDTMLLKATWLEMIQRHLAGNYIPVVDVPFINHVLYYNYCILDKLHSKCILLQLEHEAIWCKGWTAHGPTCTLHHTGANYDNFALYKLYACLYLE